MKDYQLPSGHYLDTAQKIHHPYYQNFLSIFISLYDMLPFK